MGEVTGKKKEIQPHELAIIQELETLAGTPIKQDTNVHYLISGFELNDNNEVSGIGLNCKLTTLEGLCMVLNKFPALIKFYLAAPNIKDPTPLSKLTGLKNLALAETGIPDLTSLSQLTGLQQLILFENNELIDITPVGMLTALEYLSIAGNNTTDISPVSRLTALQNLSISNNKQLDLKPISNLTALEGLTLYEVNISDFTQLAELTTLKDLTLFNVNISDLPPLSKLTALRNLFLYYTNISDLSALSQLTALRFLMLQNNNNITDLTPLSTLTRLEHLNLSNTKITDISPVSQCKQLKHLHIDETAVSDISPLSALTALKILSIDHTNITDLTPLSTCNSLQKLSCNHTKFTDQNTLSTLTRLQQLALGHTRITRFDEQLLNCFPQLESLTLTGNRILNIPKAITELANCLPDLKNYFKDFVRGQIPVYEAKVILIGNGRVGKTSLVKRWLDNTFDANEPSTHAIQLRPWLLDELAQQEHLEKIRLNIWDFGGQDIYHATHRTFMHTEAIFILVWDVQTEKTPEQPETLPNGKIVQYKNYPLEYWLSYIKILSNNSPVIIVQTYRTRDKEQTNILTDEQQKEYNVKAVLAVESSAAIANGFETLKERIQEVVAAEIKTTCATIPASWYKVRMRIAQMQEEQQIRQISLTTFKAMCGKEQLDNSSIHTLLEYFHNTGVFFYREGLFNNNIVIDQKWAIDAVYTLFDRKGHFARLHANGRFTGADLQEIWQQYSLEEQELFVSFMEQCEICFEVAYNWNKPFAQKLFVAPQLLPEMAPLTVNALCRYGDGVYYKYRHRFLHTAIIQRFMVRTGNMAKENEMWQTGIVLATPEGMALIEAFPEKNEIVIRLDDVSQKPLLDMIRSKMKEINADEAGIEELVSLDGINFVNLEHLKKHPAGNDAIQAENGNWVKTDKLRVFLPLLSEKEVIPERDKSDHLIEEASKPPKKNRIKIPQQNKIRAELQKEIDNMCPFCPSDEVGHFEIHHIDEDPGNYNISNLLLACPTCHSKITKGDIKREAVTRKKLQLQRK